jgi:hypothetical protein
MDRSDQASAKFCGTHRIKRNRAGRLRFSYMGYVSRARCLRAHLRLIFAPLLISFARIPYVDPRVERITYLFHTTFEIASDPLFLPHDRRPRDILAASHIRAY